MAQAGRLTLFLFACVALLATTTDAHAGSDLGADFGVCGMPDPTFDWNGLEVPANLPGVHVFRYGAPLTAADVVIDQLDTSGTHTVLGATLTVTDLHTTLVAPSTLPAAGATLTIAVSSCAALPDPATWANTTLYITAASPEPTSLGTLGPFGPLSSQDGRLYVAGADYTPTAEARAWRNIWWAGYEVDGVPDLGARITLREWIDLMASPTWTVDCPGFITYHPLEPGTYSVRVIGGLEGDDTVRAATNTVTLTIDCASAPPPPPPDAGIDLDAGVSDASVPPDLAVDAVFSSDASVTPPPPSGGGHCSVTSRASGAAWPAALVAAALLAVTRRRRAAAACCTRGSASARAARRA